MEEIIINHPDGVTFKDIELILDFYKDKQVQYKWPSYTVQALIDKIKEQHLEIQSLKNK